MNERSLLANTTPVPNSLLDDLLPVLSLSELRVLLLIVRQTRGWMDSSGQRKTSDWMTNRLIQKRTGCSSTSVSRAIESLAQKGLITVRDGKGGQLSTPAQRQRSLRLYFSLKEPVQQDTPVQSTPASETLYDAAQEIFKSDIEKPDKQATLFKSGYQKVTTTKENEKTKDLFNSLVDVQNLQRPINTAGNDANLLHRHKERERLLGPAGPIGPIPSRQDLPDDLKQLLHCYREGFRSHFSETAIPLVIPTVRRQELERLTLLIEKHGLETMARLLPVFFASSHLSIQKQGYSLGAFVYSTNILMLEKQFSGAFNRPRRPPASAAPPLAKASGPAMIEASDSKPAA